MKKIKLVSKKTTKNIFTIPLIVVSLLILGVLIYAAFTGTDFRSQAAGNKRIVNPIKRIVPTQQKTKSIIGATVAPKKTPTPASRRNENYPREWPVSPTPTMSAIDRYIDLIRRIFGPVPAGVRPTSTPDISN